MILLGLPICVCLCVAVAVLVAWRRQPDARHAQSWAIAFGLTGLGWLAAAVAGDATGVNQGPGAAAQLAWLAAGLSFVHGLRQRAGRSDRLAVLAAIWGAIALTAALLLDVRLHGAAPGASAAALDAVGLVVGAVAIGPRRRRTRPIDWASVVVLVGLALCHLVMAAAMLAGLLTDGLIAWLAAGWSLLYVVAGLGTMLLISGDLALALERLARTDPLTGVWNRRGFDEAGPVLLRRLAERGPYEGAAVAIADLDAFKSINDRFGHHAGDAVLARFAEQLRGALRPGDLLARLGGEEFVLLAPHSGARQLHDRLELVREVMGRPAPDQPVLPAVTASFGVAAVSPQTWSLRDAMERADRALYRAKQEGRNRTVLDGDG